MADAMRGPLGYALGTVLGASVFDDRLDRFLATWGADRMQKLRNENPFAPGLPPIRNGQGETVQECVLRLSFQGDRKTLRSERRRKQLAATCDSLARAFRKDGNVALVAFYESVAADIRRTLSELRRKDEDSDNG